MIYLVKSSDNKILKLTVVTSVSTLPEGFTLLGLESKVNPDNIDIEKASFEEVELEAERQVLVREAQLAQDEVLAQDAILDTDGVEIAPAIAHQDAVLAHDAIYMTVPAVKVMKLVEDSSKVSVIRQANANAILEAIRALRVPLLTAIDHDINIAEDDGADTSALRVYRKALRECTDSLKKANGDAKFMVESIVASEFVFPNKII